MKKKSSKPETVKAWHFLPEDGRLLYGDGRKPTDGEWVGVVGPVELCSHGMHACLRPIDALKWAPGPHLCRVELRGSIVHGFDKLVASERRILTRSDITQTLRRFGVAVARRILKCSDRPPKTLTRALKAKRAWLAGKLSDSEMGLHRQKVRNYRSRCRCYSIEYATAQAVLVVTGRYFVINQINEIIETSLRTCEGSAEAETATLNRMLLSRLHRHHPELYEH